MRRRGRDSAAAAARWIVRLRYLIAPAWIAGAILAGLYLPSIFAAGSGSLSSLIPSSSAALQAEERALETFGLPFVSRTLAVARH